MRIIRSASEAVGVLRVCARGLSRSWGVRWDGRWSQCHQHQSSRATLLQGPWSRMAAVCHLGTANAQMPMAAAGPQEACTKMPVITAPARLGASPARPCPAHHLPTVPGAAGQPGVTAAIHVDWEDSKAASGMRLGEARYPLSTGGPSAWYMSLIQRSWLGSTSDTAGQCPSPALSQALP